MFAQAYQSGFISLLYSVGPRPLQLCEKQEEVPGQSVRRVLDEDVQSSVIELQADNLVHTWVRFPSGVVDDQQDQQETSSFAPVPAPAPTSTSLHIRLPHLVLLLKNLEQHTSVEVQVADDRGTRRRFRLSTFQKQSAVHPELALLPLHLDAGWNQVQVDLVELMHTCYGARYSHAISVQLHASCRVRRVYFAERMFAEHQLPPEFRLFKRLTKTQTQCFRQQQQDTKES